MRHIIVNGRPVKSLEDGDQVKLRGFSWSQTFGSISGYAARYNDDEKLVRERIDRAVKLGHRIVWFNANATIISNPPPPRVNYIVLDEGEVVHVDSKHDEERGIYRVRRPGVMDGDSCQLDRVDAIYEVWGAPSERETFKLLLQDEVAPHINEMMKHADFGQHVHVVKHNPLEYTFRFKDESEEVSDPRD